MYIYIFFIIIFGVLQLVLFFKIWGMTNDIKDIRNKYLGENKHIETNEYTLKYPIGSEVRDINGNQILIVKDFDSVLNKYTCYTKEGLFVGHFSSNELTK